MAKPDVQTVAQMAATIASGLVAGWQVAADIKSNEVANRAVAIARAIVAEVERAETEEQHDA